jgi:hypothetical protein
MLSDKRLKEITKGGRQSLFWSRKIAKEQELETLQSECGETIGDIFRSWLTSKISDDELCHALGICKYDWDILIQEKQATWNSYVASLVDECDHKNCKVKRILNGTT